MVLLNNIETGDLCIFSNGDQARVTMVKQNTLFFDEPVEGYKDRGRRNYWSYRPNGEFIVSNNEPHVNIVKVLKDG